MGSWRRSGGLGETITVSSDARCGTGLAHGHSVATGSRTTPRSVPSGCGRHHRSVLALGSLVGPAGLDAGRWRYGSSEWLASGAWSSQPTRCGRRRPCTEGWLPAVSQRGLIRWNVLVQRGAARLKSPAYAPGGSTETREWLAQSWAPMRLDDARGWATDAHSPCCSITSSAARWALGCSTRRRSEGRAATVPPGIVRRPLHETPGRAAFPGRTRDARGSLDVPRLVR